jgi:hypothetical protein
MNWHMDRLSLSITAFPNKPGNVALSGILMAVPGTSSKAPAAFTFPEPATRDYYPLFFSCLDLLFLLNT